MREKIFELLITAIWKVRQPKMKIDGLHRIGLDTEIHIINNGVLRIGNHVKTKNRAVLSVVDGIMTIGDNVCFNRNNLLICHERISIGNQCAFGPNVIMYDHDHKFGFDGIEVNEFNTSPIIIEDRCWIGANVTILKGTHIGEKSIIGAGAIVKGNIPPHSLVIGTRDLIVKSIKDA